MLKSTQHIWWFCALLAFGGSLFETPAQMPPAAKSGTRFQGLETELGGKANLAALINVSDDTEEDDIVHSLQLLIDDNFAPLSGVGGPAGVQRMLDNGSQGIAHLLSKPFPRAHKVLLKYIDQLTTGPDSAKKWNRLVLVPSDIMGPLIVLLSKGHPDIQAYAASLLSKIGPQAIKALPAIEKLLDSKEVEVRCAALAATIRLRKTLDIELERRVQKMVKTEPESFQRVVFVSLRMADSKAAKLLWEFYNCHPDEDLKEFALGCLYLCNDPGYSMRTNYLGLIDNLKAPSNHRIVALMGLRNGNLVDEATLVKILQLMRCDTSSDIRLACVWELPNHPKFANISIVSLRNSIENDTDKYVRAAASVSISILIVKTFRFPHLF